MRAFLGRNRMKENLELLNEKKNQNEHKTYTTRPNPILSNKLQKHHLIF